LKKCEVHDLSRYGRCVRDACLRDSCKIEVKYGLEMLAAGIYLFVSIIVLILIIYVIVNRIEEKKKERFEKRDF
jgi:hypothetical protein